MVWLQEAKQIWTSRRAMPAMLVISSPRAVRGSVHTAERMHSWAPSERHLSAIWAPSEHLVLFCLCHSCATPVPPCFPLWDLVGQGEAPSRKAHNPNVSAHVSIATFLRGVRLNENVSKPLPYIFCILFLKYWQGLLSSHVLLLRCAYGTCWCSGFPPSLEEEAAEPGEQWYFVGLLVAIVVQLVNTDNWAR